MGVVEGIDVRGMRHCETTALGVLLRHEGIDLSEPMLFGLGSGLSFIYWDGKNLDFPFLGGRVKPFELTRNLTGLLGLELRVEETTSPGRAWRNVATQIDAGRPVGLQLDSYHLDYFTSRVRFGGHVVAMYGYDDEYAYLVDTAQQGGAVRTGLESLAKARAERGQMTARHRSFTITAPGPVSVTPDLLQRSDDPEIPEEIIRFLSEHPELEAVATVDAMLAKLVGKACYQMGRTDMRIICFDEPSYSKNAVYPTAYIDQSPVEVGRIAVRLAMEALEGQQEPKKCVIEPRLVELS